MAYWECIMSQKCAESSKMIKWRSMKMIRMIGYVINFIKCTISDFVLFLHIFPPATTFFICICFGQTRIKLYVLSPT